MNKVQDVTKRGLNNLQEKANYIMSEHISTPSNNDDEVYKQYLALLDFFNDYLALSPFLEKTILEAEIIQDSEVFRNKIINKKINTFKGILEQYEVKQINENSTEIELLKYYFNHIIVDFIDVLNLIKATYSKNEDSYKTTM